VSVSIWGRFSTVLESRDRLLQPLNSKKLSSRFQNLPLFHEKTAIWVNFQYLVGLAGMVIKDLAADFLHLTIF
jgi:hypothetical protein